MEKTDFNSLDIKKLNTNKGLHTLLGQETYSPAKALRFLDYEKKLKKLQIELVRLQTWVMNKEERVIVIFEGRDAAGKGGAIRRMTERINQRNYRIVALPKPNDEEKSQWYFQRYINQFPNAGEIVFFDRSWYNRAVVEPVNGFCTAKEYDVFMNQVNDFERMITESGIRLVKIYMSISKTEQAKRFKEIKSDPLKQWKMTPVDEKAQELWDEYTKYKKLMFENTNKGNLPFKVIKANRKTSTRIGVIQHVLDAIPYDKNLKV
ncbi:MAG TPA: polyphosphate kinase 2 [Flavobacteriaceae bacterium]|jgi:polyphosphate kinase 2|nr:polyphosphate kinase 2 [Flavobacteriaceae bacterium]HBS11595.1 polyphosphate kinase 2 [Flavobacteriaceae bacterium]